MMITGDHPAAEDIYRVELDGQTAKFVCMYDNYETVRRKKGG